MWLVVYHIGQCSPKVWVWVGGMVKTITETMERRTKWGKFGTGVMTQRVKLPHVILALYTGVLV